MGTICDLRNPSCTRYYLFIYSQIETTKARFPKQRELCKPSPRINSSRRDKLNAQTIHFHHKQNTNLSCLNCRLATNIHIPDKFSYNIFNSDSTWVYGGRTTVTYSTMT